MNFCFFLNKYKIKSKCDIVYVLNSWAFSGGAEDSEGSPPEQILVVHLIACAVCDVILMNLLFQVQAGPLPDFNAQQHNESAKQVEPAPTEAQAKVIVSEHRVNQILSEALNETTVLAV